MTEPTDGADAARTPPARRNIGRSTTIMASGTIVSRGLGFVRNALLAGAIGVNAGAANAYEVANKIPNSLYAILAAGVLNAALVPQIVKAFQREGGKRTVDRILTIGGVISLAVTIVFTAGAAILVRLYSDQWSPALVALATAFALWCIPQLFFYGMYTLMGQVLNARSQFGPFMWAPAVNNVIGIAGLIAYLAIFGQYAIPPDGATPTVFTETWSPGRIALLAGVATAGIAAQAAILVWPLIRGGYRWRWTWRGPKGELRGIRVVASWALGAVIVEQIAVALTSRVATAANPNDFNPEIAGNAAYYNALIIYLMPHSVVTVSIVTALFTSMSALRNSGNLDGLRTEISRGIRMIGVFTLLATVILVALAPLIVRVALPSAEPVVVMSVAEVLMVMSLGLVPLGLMVLMKYVFFVLEDAKSIFLIHIPMAIAWVGIAWLGRSLLEPRWWVVMVAFGMVASNIIAVALRAGGLRRRVGGLDGRRVGLTYGKSMLAALPTAALGWLILHVAPPLESLVGWSGVIQAAVICILGAIVMTVVYGVVLRLLRVEEMTQIVAPVMRKLGRQVR